MTDQKHSESSIGDSLTDLAILLYEEGRYEEAEDRFLQALEVQKELTT